VRAAAPPTTGRLIRWARWYDVLLRFKFLGQLGKLRQVPLDLAALRPGERVLDVGCGTGELTLAAARRVGPGGLVVGIDAAPEMIEVARGKARRGLPPVRFLVEPVEALSFPDGSFDAVLSSLMIHHLPGDLKARALGEIRRVLRPGGCLYASTLGGGHMAEVRALLRRFQHGAGYDHYFLRGIGFNLETGADELAPWFPSVRLRRYDDALVVTEAAPLVAYIRSLLPLPEGVPGDPRSDLTAFIQQELDTHGPLHISTDTGLFIAGPGAAP
jgi:ubiquinone/menaquinone biosynthesis C-methylase UbiE